MIPADLVNEDLDGLTIRMSDLVPRYCAWGAKAWFKAHGLDFADFLKNGISARQFVDKGDDLSAVVVRRKLAEVKSGQ